MESSTPRQHLYRVQGFTILAHSHRDACMEWLASLETGEKVWLPSITLSVEDLTKPEETRWMLVSDALRRRDRERARCGLPPYWEEIAAYLEANQDYFTQRAAEAAEEEAGA